MDGIRVNRVALYPSHDKSAWRRIANYLSFAVMAAVVGPFLVKRPDVIYVYHPPITVGLPAVVLGWLKRAPFVYDIQDLWPDTVAVSGMMRDGWALRLVGWWCGFVYRRARQLVVLSPGFKRVLTGRGVAAERIDVIYNWCDEEMMRPVAPDTQLAVQFGLGEGLKVMFAGTMGVGQGLDTVLDAARICRDRVPGAQFVFVGGGIDRDRLMARARQMGLGNALFLPRQEMREMGRVLALADVLLVHLRDEKLFRITIPSKTQAYLAAGKPVLLAVRGDAEDLVEESGGGVVCEPEDAESMAEAVESLARMSREERRDMGSAGRAFYRERLSLESGVTQFERVFRAASGQGELGEVRRAADSSRC
jgi:glycosyltransferase involved in cell wall biosynthesis